MPETPTYFCYKCGNPLWVLTIEGNKDEYPAYQFACMNCPRQWNPRVPPFCPNCGYVTHMDQKPSGVGLIESFWECLDCFYRFSYVSI